VAKGLLARYGDEALRIKREQQGLPFSVAQAQAAAGPPQAAGRRPEVNAASTALDTALNGLTTDPDLSDIEPELRGWSQNDPAGGVRRPGLRPVMRSMPASGIARSAPRRILGDYGRLARYAGALTSLRARPVLSRGARLRRCRQHHPGHDRGFAR